jgi:hypothetical protein
MDLDKLRIEKVNTMNRIILGIAVLLTAVFAASALASGNGPTGSVYHHKGTQVQSVVGSSTPPSASLGAKATKTPSSPSTPSASSSDLPFTGLDLGLLAAAGIVLVGMGFSLRRVTRTRKPPVS